MKRKLVMRLLTSMLTASMLLGTFGTSAVFASEIEVCDETETEAVSEDAGEEIVLEAASTDTGYGSNQKVFAAGTYTVPASLMKSDAITSPSMAATCIAGDATMVVDADGNAKVTVPITAVTVTMGSQTITSYAKEWKAYKSDLTSEAVACEYTTDGSGNVNSITFSIEDKSLDGVYVNMNTGRSAADAYLALDYATAKQTGYGTANKEIAAGTYTVPASLMKSDAITSPSMAATCIAGDATMVVDAEGNAKVTVPITSVTVTMGTQTITSYAKEWKAYKSDLTSEAVACEYTTDEAGNVNSITFSIEDKSLDGVYVNMNTGRSAADAYLALDYSKIAVKQETKTEDPQATNSKQTTTTTKTTTTTTTVKKKAPTLKVKKVSVKYKKSKLKKSKKSFKIGATVTGNGKISYSVVKYGSKKAKKYVSLNKKTGAVTVKKKTPKGTYKMTVKIQANASKNYTAKSIKKVITVRVK